MRLQNKVALGTPAARGLRPGGVAGALGLAGARVGVTDFYEAGLARTARELAADGTGF